MGALKVLSALNLLLIPIDDRWVQLCTFDRSLCTAQKYNHMIARTETKVKFFKTGLLHHQYLSFIIL